MSTSWHSDADRIQQYRDSKRPTADLPGQTTVESGWWLMALLLLVMGGTYGAFLLFGGAA